MHYVKKVFPLVNKELDNWVTIVQSSPAELLREQALASIKLKRFHAQGGSVYALYPNVEMQSAVRFIVALQTISDYLDNLCDRTGIQDELTFRQLHMSMIDACYSSL